ncbi:MAG: polyhydroxyalkanoate synthesis repressor PhaR [Alphaproteobacteria bacterium]|nr:polyhydroxyalkanoate synthesis repressor PhaR [Alphaproteobacteria bacterium]
MTEPKKAPVTIKKYANRRLYNTASSSYVTLDDLSRMVKDEVDFVVYDAKTGEDITRSVLTQIIFEAENNSGQAGLLPASFLRQLIRFYGDSLQAALPSYLDMSMESFARNQEQMRDLMKQSFGGMGAFQNFEEAARQNMAMFQRAMAMFSPFGGVQAADGKPRPETAKAGEGDQIKTLREQLNAMQRQLDKMGRDRG